MSRIKRSYPIRCVVPILQPRFRRTSFPEEGFLVARTEFGRIFAESQTQSGRLALRVLLFLSFRVPSASSTVVILITAGPGGASEMASVVVAGMDWGGKGRGN